MVIVLFLSGLFLSTLTSTYLPFVTFSAIALLIVGTLVKLKEQSYDENIQKSLFVIIIVCCLILYYLLTGEIFIASEIFNLITGLLA